MKNLKRVTSVVTLVLVMLVSANLSSQNHTYSEKQILEVKEKVKEGMSSFVASIKPVYKKGMTFNSFKMSLIGKNIKSITKEGDDLLFKAFGYLQN